MFLLKPSTIFFISLLRILRRDDKNYWEEHTETHTYVFIPPPPPLSLSLSIYLSKRPLSLCLHLQLTDIGLSQLNILAKIALEFGCLMPFDGEINIMITKDFKSTKRRSLEDSELT